ncbi:MAG: hypothetical protein NC924_00280 [Candidatus Omnitrophica bacterium]|nr:hypothetical protein [Candidatus Omnitrophota bacterium]
MKVIIDGQQRDIAPGNSVTVEDFIELLKPIVDKENKIISNICINGACMVVGRETEWRGQKLDGVERLEILTESPFRLTISTLARSRDYLGAFQGQIEKFLDVLQLGGEESAYDTFIADLEGLRTIVGLFENVRAMYGLDFSRLMVGERSIDTVSDDMAGIFTQIKTAVQEQDVVYLQDLLRYELIPLTDTIRGVVDSLTAELTAREKNGI